ncbi:PREDICTED: glutamate decarboxylase 1-like isoform X2 [Branchiostoma belcheri]|uniref:Glutamate decarboxylase 1-like isoform X2 n=1 Tax=Branchiostoma belcheri TaxID=7741 RepID=A0A6P4Y3I6_BRABE|nr:PREDICTED: glutamate decarboxylase 1-like isoform X2 [Branchiostoma belcheri]
MAEKDDERTQEICTGAAICSVFTKLIKGFLHRDNTISEEDDMPAGKDALKGRSESLEAPDNIIGEESRNSFDFETAYARDLLPARNAPATTTLFLTKVVEILCDYVRKTYDRSEKVVDFHHPQDLKKFLDLEIPDERPETLEKILESCRETLKYGVKTGHPRFFNQLSSGMDVISLAGEWLTATANTNMFTYEIAPVFIVMEEMILKKMREIIGFPAKSGDGIFSPGGAISNLYAVNCARYKFVPDVKKKGLREAPKLVMYISEHSHYSLKRAAAIVGIGTDNVYAVKCDERGKMIPSDLERKIQIAKSKGETPFFVSASGGSTVYGAFDPLHDLADICQRHKMWLHVDCAWGGGVLLSKKYRKRLDGIERADSVTWNPHKLMGVILQCSCLLLKESNLLQRCNSMCADYLFQQDKNYDVSYDTGDKTIQCGRHVDVFKLWLMWRAKATVGFEAQINKCFDLAHYMTDKLKAREGFEMVVDEPELTNVCFWYLPPSIRDLPDGPDKRDRLAQVAPVVKARMMDRGMTMIGYQPLGDNVNFFRMVISNPAATTADIDYMIEEIERLGQDL